MKATKGRLKGNIMLVLLLAVLTVSGCVLRKLNFTADEIRIEPDINTLPSVK